MNLQFTLAYRYLSGRKLRTFLTTLAVVFGVMVIFGMNIILPTMIEAFQANMMAAGGVVDVTVALKSNGGFPLAVADKLNGIEGIRAYSPLLDRAVNLPPDFVDNNPAVADRITAINLVGVEPDKARALQAYLIQEPGRFLQADDTNAAVISQTLADAYGVKLGETIQIPTVNGIQKLAVLGILPPRTQPGNEEILVTLATAQALTGQADQISAIEVALTTMDETLRDQTVKAIESAMGSDFTVGALQAGSEMFASLKLGQQAFNMFGVMALFMGGFIIFNTFLTVVAERRRDIGMLRALGAKRGTITGTIMIEGVIQGVIGTTFGLLLGYLMGTGITKLAGPMLTQFLNVQMGNPVISPTLVLTSILLGVGITVLAGLIPAVNASRVTPMDALRPTVAEVEYKRRMSGGFITGLVFIGISLLGLISGNMGLIGLGALLFLVGIILITPMVLRPIAWFFGRLTTMLYARQGIGDLAQGNLTRQPGRVAITASATMIGLAVVVALGGMTSSMNAMMGPFMQKSLGSDYLFVPPSIAVWNSDMGVGNEFTDQLKAIDGVGDISSFRFASSAANGSAISLLGIDPVTYPKVSGLVFNEGNEDTAYTDLAKGRNMIVNGSFLSTISAKVGDTVELSTPTGTQKYKIVAAATDMLNAKVVTAFISQDNLAADFGRTDDVFIQLNLAQGANAKAVDTAIKAAAVNYPQFTIIAGKTYIDQMMQLISVVFVGMYFLLAVLALPSLIAMLNTLAINVIERTREIGMIRAVGGTRKQVRRMIVAEALLLAAVGTAFGILAGMYLGYVIVEGLAVMFPMTYSFPLSGILAGIAIGLLFGALAAIIPARQAAKMNVVEALRYE